MQAVYFVKNYNTTLSFEGPDELRFVPIYTARLRSLISKPIFGFSDCGTVHHHDWPIVGGTKPDCELSLTTTLWSHNENVLLSFLGHVVDHAKQLSVVFRDIEVRINISLHQADGYLSDSV